MARPIMRRLVVVAFVAIALAHGASAADCNSLSAPSAAAAVALPTGCTRVLGDVVITAQDLTQLPANIFGSIRNITGTLRVSSCRTLASLDGLNAVVAVGSLEVLSNPMLKTLQGLGSLAKVTGNVTISANVALTSLAGLESLSSIGKVLTITTNVQLGSADGLSALTSVGTLSISQNDALANLNALSNLAVITSDATIAGNDGLLDLNGLCGLGRVGGSLALRSNNKLGSIDGLVMLTNISGNLFVEKNAVLLTIDAFRSLKSVGGSVAVQLNSKLCYTSDVPFAAVTAGGVFVANNRLPDDPCPATRPIPNWPANGRAPTVAVVQSRSLPLLWVPATNDNGLVFKYEVLSNNTVIGTLDLSATSTSGSTVRFRPVDNPITFTATNLSPFTVYYIAIKAYNLAGARVSDYATIRTYSDIPDGVAAPNTTVLDARTVQVSWTPPTTTNGPITSYVVRRDGTVTFEGSALSYRDAGLDPYTTYSYTVEAKTVAGGRQSDATNATTKEDKPFQVRAPAIAGTSPTTLFIVWPIPGQPNGVITKYELYLVRGAARSLVYTGVGRTFSMTGLTANTQYTFLVTAYTSQGSTESLPASGKTQPNYGPDGAAAATSPALALIALVVAFAVAMVVPH